jgi:peptidoglycan/LPS O-acetylase OafA/YrhL
MESKRIPELDGVRGLAVLMVMLSHCIVTQVEPQPGTPLAYLQLLLTYSWTGVDLFFVLSGFLIGGILLDNKSAVNYFRVFYTRRVFRILPLYYLFLIITVLIYLSPVRDIPTLGNMFNPSLPLWPFFLHLQNFAMVASGTLGGYWLVPTWSLAVEEHFYLIIPFVIKFAKNLTFWMVGVVILSITVRLVILLSTSHWLLPTYLLTFARADALAIGVLMAAGFRTTKIPTSAMLWLFFTGCAVVLLMLKMRLTTSSPAFALGGYTFFALLYACLIILAMTKFAPVFRVRWLRRLGTLAYCLYLIHLPVNALTHAAFSRTTVIHSMADFSITLLAFALMVALASLSWRYFEKPAIRMGHRDRYLIEQARAYR